MLWIGVQSEMSVNQIQDISNSRVSLDRIRIAREIIDPVFRNTPQYRCEPLSSIVGVDLTLKVETCNPIRSFKGRGADFLVGSSKEKHLICASAGNFGQAMAYACRKKHVLLTVFASTNANSYKIERMRSLGAEVILAGEDFDAAKVEARKEAVRTGLPMVEDALAIETLEGAGTIGLEMLEDGVPESVRQHMVTLDALLIPLGNGALFNGVARVFKELSPQTKMIAVQAAGAPSMLDSWRENRVIVYEKIDTIADGIGVRIPIPQALQDMRGLADEGITVREESILVGMKLLHVHAGLVSEPSAVVGIAAILENKSRFAGMKVATIICGGNLTEAQIKAWL